jgi:hypothetical protein
MGSDGFANVLDECLAVRRGEHVALLTDGGTDTTLQDLAARARPLAKAALNAPAPASTASSALQAPMRMRPREAGIPAVALGVICREGEHTPGRWIDTAPMAGLAALAGAIRQFREGQG